MARTRKGAQFERFYFTIDARTRSYGFEINRHKWEFQPYDYVQRDCVVVVGRLRNKSN